METTIDIVFHSNFYDSDYSNDAAATPGRMETIITEIKNHNDYNILSPKPAELSDIKLVHHDEHIEKVMQDRKLHCMALLSVGTAIKASEIAMTARPAISIARHHGHHAYRNSIWGYCLLLQRCYCPETFENTRTN